LMIPQAVTEAVLLDRLRELGGRVLRPYEVIGLADGDAAGTGVLATFAGGETLRARYVVAADGLHSTVRRLAGIGFAGHRGAHLADAADELGESFVLADVSVTGDVPRDEVVLFFSRPGMLFWAPFPDGTFRMVAATARDAPPIPDITAAQSLLDTRGPAGARPTVTDIVWSSRFRVRYGVADRLRAGPVLLAGDAGHVHSPAGGQGMNLGLREAVALGDALGDVLDGEPDSILDDYAAARKAFAHEVVVFTDRLTRLATLTPTLRPIRNAALRLLSAVPAVRQGLARQLAGLADR
jgi:2-polyprenyl-6-methoxyphenol hydroxylase-like FAD-dependent oxidoreductase